MRLPEVNDIKNQSFAREVIRMKTLHLETSPLYHDLFSGLRKLLEEKEIEATIAMLTKVEKILKPVPPDSADNALYKFKLCQIALNWMIKSSNAPFTADELLGRIESILLELN